MPPLPVSRVVLERLSPRTAWTAAAWYVVLTAAMTWPLLPGLTRDIPWDLGDSLLNCWILAWNGERLLRVLGGDLSALQGFYDTNIFHPQPLTLAYSETLFAQTLQVLPVYALTKNLILSYNLLVFSSYVLSGLGAYLLARELTGDWRAAFLAGVIFAFVPWRVAQLPHMQVLSTQWMPLTLYGLRRYFDTRRAGALAGATAALLLNNHSNGYYLLFFAPVVAGYALWEMARRGLLRDLRACAAMAAAGAVTAALTVPFLLPYIWLRQSTGEHRGLGEVAWFSADVAAYATVHEQLWLWGDVMRAYPRAEGDLFPGLVPVALALVALGAGWRRTRARALAALADAPRPGRAARLVATAALLVIVTYALVALMVVTGQGGRMHVGPIELKATSATRALWAMGLAALVLLAASARARWMSAQAWRAPVVFVAALTLVAWWLSLGPAPQVLGREISAPSLYAPLYHHVPGFDGLRVPARFAALVMLGLALLAAFGARDLSRRGARAALPLVLSLAFLVESAAMPLPMNLTTADRVLPPPGRVFPFAESPPLYRRVAALPAGAVLVELPFGDTSWELQYVYYSTVHWKRMLNGYSGGFPEAYLKLRAHLEDPLREPADSAAALRATDATHLVLHEAAYPAAELARLRDWIARLGATPVERFGSSVLYALPD